MITVDDVLAEARKSQRICPLPKRWAELYELLPERRRLGGGFEPPAPLILAAWHDAPALLKTLRLQEHIEWAAAHGALEEVFDFMRGLPEEDWYHFGD